MNMRLKKVSATGGFLQNVDLEFKAGLNCIIGARGTCKSTLVESIRFAFNCGDRKVEQLTTEIRSAARPYKGKLTGWSNSV
jgi:predicted ATPase